jgi:hypothetical protein
MIYKKSTVTIDSEYYYNLLEYLSKDYILYDICGFNKKHKYSVNNFKKILAHVKKTKLNHTIEINPSNTFIEVHYILPMKNGRQPDTCGCTNYDKTKHTLDNVDCIRFTMYWEASRLLYVQQVFMGGHGYQTNNHFEIKYSEINNDNKVIKDILINELFLMEYLLHLEDINNKLADEPKTSTQQYRWNTIQKSNYFSDLMKFLKIQAM